MKTHVPLPRRFRAWRYVGRAERLAARGELAAATEWYRRAAEHAPSAGRCLHLAIARADSGDADGAIESARNAAKLDPGDPVARSVVAFLLADCGSLEEAQQESEAATERGAEHPMATAAALYVRMAKGSDPAALRALAEDPIVDSPFVRARLLMRIEQIILDRERGEHYESEDRPSEAQPEAEAAANPQDSVIDDLLGRSARHRARQAVRRGLKHFERDDVERAAEAFEQAVLADPSSEEARLYLGCALFELDQYERAAALLKPFVEKDPDNSLAAFHYGAACCRLHRFDEALAMLSRVEEGQTKFDFQEWLPYFQGVALLGLGRLAEARRRFEIVCDFSWPFLQERAQAALDGTSSADPS